MSKPPNINPITKNEVIFSQVHLAHNSSSKNPLERHDRAVGNDDSNAILAS